MSNLFTSPRDLLIVGNRVFTNLTSLIVLGAQNDGNDFATFRMMHPTHATAGYQITAGKSFQIIGVKWSVTVVGSGEYISLLYGDTDVGQDAAAAPTTPIYPGGDTRIGIVANSYAQDTSPLITDFWWKVPAQKYPAVRFNGATRGSVHLYGYEV